MYFQSKQPEDKTEIPTPEVKRDAWKQPFSKFCSVVLSKISKLLFELQPVISKIIIPNIGIYDGPNDFYATQIGTVQIGSSIEATGLNADNTWYKVNYNGQVGYTRADMVSLEP